LDFGPIGTDCKAAGQPGNTPAVASIRYKDKRVNILTKERDIAVDDRVQPMTGHVALV